MKSLPFWIAAAVFALAPGECLLAGDAQRITHGPILGRPGARQMGVWARTALPGTFKVRFGLQAGMLDQISSATPTRLQADNTGWVLLGDLKPDTRYYYRVEVEGAGPDAAVTGSFRTLPDAEGYRHPRHNPRGLFNFQFEVSSCANQGEHSRGPSLPVYRTMLDRIGERVAFSIHNGDFIYEEKREYPAAEWLAKAAAGKVPLPESVALTPTITGVWENYKLYLERGKNLAAWHRKVPCYFTFDDHEILNDMVAAGTAGTRNRRTVFRDIAVQAWYDYVGWSNPVEFSQGIHFGRAELKGGSDILTDPGSDFTRLDREQMANLHVHWGTPDAGVNDDKLDTQPGDPNAGVYDVVEVLDRHRLRIRPAARKDGRSTYSIGRRSYYRTRVGNSEFFFLDTRTHRQQHDFKKPDRPGISLLGERQKRWLIDAMRGSDADCFFVVSSVNFTIPHVGAGGMAVAAEDKDDAWTAFVAEREELIRFWDTLRRPVLVFTGDLHNSFAVKVSSRVWEFGAGPLNSNNHPASSEGGRPANGPFVSRGRPVDIRWSTYLLDDILQAKRPQLPVYCVVQVNNVIANQPQGEPTRWVAYPFPQVVVQYYSGLTGELLYAESVRAGKEAGVP